MGSVQARPDQANSGSAAESVPTSAQFYSFTQSGLSTAELIYEMEAAGYDYYFEPFTISDDSDVDAITDAIDETGVGMSSAHQGLDETLDDPEAVAERYLQYGEPALIEPYIGPDTWSTESSVLDLAHDVNTARGTTWPITDSSSVITTTITSSSSSTTPTRPATTSSRRRSKTTMHLQLDVGWVETGGANPTEYISRYKDKISSIHMKNMEGRWLRRDRRGRRQHETVANVARAAADVDYLIYEYDRAPQPIESMNIGGEFLGRWNGPRRGRN